jgi:hypothetical protein
VWVAELLIVIPVVLLFVPVIPVVFELTVIPVVAELIVIPVVLRDVLEVANSGKMLEVPPFQP